MSSFLTAVQLKGNAMREEMIAKKPYDGSGQLGLATPRQMNPTMRENIEAKIQYHKDEIERLETVKTKMPQLLDVNLRDLREAMSF